MRVLIFGTGAIAKGLTYHIRNTVEIVAYVVSDEYYKENEYLGKKVIKISEINEQVFDQVIMATIHHDEIEKKLQDYGVEMSKIVNYYGRFLNIFDERLAMLRRVAEDIENKNIQGAVAELGVYKGNFAQYINEVFSDRKFYLFDTFSGFDERDVVYDKNMSLSDSCEGEYKNTDVQLVLEKMKFPENCIIRKGYFPLTSEGLDEKFVFVSMDVDLYLPIYEGLKYFYPRLETGGCIFIHDYNNPKYKGVKEAVQEYCNERKIPYISMCDYGGSVIVLK